jgi:hypothetical protein
MPDSIDRTSVQTAIAAIKPTLAACGDRYPMAMSAKARVQVHPDGHVTNVVVDAGSEIELADCVAKAVRRARFPRTQHGGSFSYPFVFN